MTESVVTQLNAALQGRYTVERMLGEGGMAKVYLADDLRHERKVAIKVLNPDLAALVGAERFLAEIKTTANLQHPHILPLFDSGQAGGFVFYVMPFVEGESLRERLDRDVQLPVDEAVRLATAVANALGYAHRQGVIHRDVKPENVLMQEGEPLVADFGIALAVSSAGGSRLTETGLSLGTPYYMSPEQASADRELGPQADVYSVGCMLYEMLVGDPPHTGKTAQAVLAKILTERPRTITSIRATVPPHVAAAVARSLERLPADRFESAEEFVRALGDVAFTHEPVAATQATRVPALAAPAPKQSPAAKWAPWGVAAAALAVAAWALIPEPAPIPIPPTRLTLSDFEVHNADGGGWRVAISPDGSVIVAGGADGLLYQRRSDDQEFRPIPGTEGARHPAISPDGGWLVFTQNGGLFKVQLTGGPVLPVADAGAQPHWFDQGEIVYNAANSVYIVSSAGGTPRLIAEDGGRPFMLPGGRGVLVELGGGVSVVDLESGEATEVASGGSNPRYAPTGHVLYGDRSLQSVMAVRFDIESLAATGDAVPVLPSVRVFGGGATQLAVSDNGTLVYIQGSGSSVGTARLAWIEPDGSRTELPLRVTNAAAPRVSPDGTRLAYADAERVTISVYDIQTGAQTHIEAARTFPVAVWSRDGSRLFVTVGGGNGWNWVSHALDGSGAAEDLASNVPARLTSLSPDGRWLIAEGDQDATQPDIVFARLDSGEVAIRPYLRAAWHEEDGQVSPDGRWLAYVSNESGDHQVYVRSFPEPGPAALVSEEGVGAGPVVWSPDGTALFYQQDDRMMRREVRLDATVELGEVTDLLYFGDLRGSAQFVNWDRHPDGRFIVLSSGPGEVAPTDDEEPTPGIGRVVVVVSWFTELRQRMGEGN